MRVGRRKKKLVFLGDSNTHQNLYLKYLETIFISGKPETEVEFINCGIGGDTASKGLDRLDAEVLAANPSHVYVMFGTNDLNLNLYTNQATYDSKSAERAAAMNSALGYLELIVRRLKTEGIAVSFMTPVSYDDRAAYTDVNAAAMYGYSDALKEYSQKVSALANRLGIEVIDVNTWMNECHDAFVKTGSTETGLMRVDRIHLSEYGGVVAAVKMAQDMGVRGLASSVTITAGGAAEAENAEISNVTADNGGMRFTYLPKTIPMAADETYHTVKKNLYDLDEFNKEIFKATGLEENSSYTMTIDGSVIGTFTGKQLAEGINIASIAANPAQEQARIVSEKMQEKRTLMIKLRDIALAEVKMKMAGVDITDAAAVNAWIDRNDPDKNTSYQRYMANKAEEESMKTGVAALTAEARKAAQPVAREVVVTKVN